MVGSHKVAGPYDSKKLYGQMASVQAVFGSTYQNVAMSMLNLTSEYCDDSLLAEQVRAIYRPPEHLWTPDRPVNEASVKVDC